MNQKIRFKCNINNKICFKLYLYAVWQFINALLHANFALLESWTSEQYMITTFF